MKINITHLIAGIGLIVLIASFVPQQQEPTLQEAFKQIKALQGQVSNLKTSLNSQKTDFEQDVSDLKTTISDNKRESNQKINDVLLKSLPVGSIVSFGLEATSLPSGWILCDGRKISDASSIYNGYNVPDLRSQFIRGKSSSETLASSYGSNSHSHSMPKHKHEVGSHTHSFTTNSSSISYGGSCAYGIACKSEGGQKQYILFGNSESEYRSNTSHSHSGTTGNASSGYTAEGGEGYTGSESNIPKYIALNYIIKIK